MRRDFTEFSLNKRGRWTLPNQLRSEILNGAFKHERYGVQLVEGHKLIKRDCCISFVSSFGKVRQSSIKKRKSKQKRRGYFQYLSIVNQKPANTSSRRRHQNRHRHRQRIRLTQDNAEPEGEPVQEYKPPEIRYEVLYPSSITSSITHNPKYIDPNHGCTGQSSRKRKQRKARSKLVNVIQEELDMLDYDFNDSEEEESVSYPEPAERETSVTLEEILRHANKAQSLVASSGKQRQSSTGSDTDIVCKDTRTIIYINKDESESVAEVKPKTQTDKHTTVTLNPVSVILSKEDADEWVLKQKFGERVLECDCFPRKFVIDISEDVSELDNFKYIDYSRADTVFACLVFVYDSDNEINNMREEVYKVILNMPFSAGVSSIRIETLFDFMMTNVDEIVKKAIFFVETLPTDVVAKEKRQHAVSKSSMCSNLENCAKWESGSYILNTKHLLERCFHSQQAQEAHELEFELVSKMDAFSTEPLDISVPTDKFCSICFESVGGAVSATALMSCGHWFCDVCWTEHLVTGIREGRTNLVCPEYDCDKGLDTGTLMTLVDGNHVIQYLRRCHDTEVEQRSVAKWCPDPACGGVIEVPSTQVKAVTCTCGRKMCFDCLGEVHWPAPCKAASAYRQKLVDNGHEKLLPFEDIQTIEIDGKNCPFCNRFIEKNGGCPYMHCVCQKAFCWACEKEWNSTQHGPNCFKNGYKNKYQTTTETIDASEYLNSVFKGSSHEKWYKIALEHRTKQHRVKIQKLWKPMRELRSKLQHYVGRQERRKESITFDFSIPGKHYTSEAAKTGDFLNCLMELYSELNRIAEHVAVYMQTKQSSGKVQFPVKHITNRMAALSVFIYDLLLNGANIDQKHVFNRLKDIRFHARKCITGLVKCINHVEG